MTNPAGYLQKLMTIFLKNKYNIFLGHAVLYLHCFIVYTHENSENWALREKMIDFNASCSWTTLILKRKRISGNLEFLFWEIYVLAFVCIIRSFAGTYKQTAFICKETNSIKFIWLMLNLPKSCKLVHLWGFSKF